MPFWRAALGYEPRRDSPAEDLVDPHGRGPGFWFERMNEPRADGGGAIHVAVWVPHEHAEARIAAALAAGGRMVRDEFARSWWTWLTQPETRSTSPPLAAATELPSIMLLAMDGRRKRLRQRLGVPGPIVTDTVDEHCRCTVDAASHATHEVFVDA